MVVEITKEWRQRRVVVVFLVLVVQISFAGPTLASLPESSCTNASGSWTAADRIILEEIKEIRATYNKSFVKLKGMRVISACSIAQTIQRHLLIDEDYTEDSKSYFECVLDHYIEFC